MMSQRSKGELVEVIRPRYLKASRREKTTIIDEFIVATDYHRKHALRLLKKGYAAKGTKKRGRRKKYKGEVIQVMIKIWEICGRICSKRLQPFLKIRYTLLAFQGLLCFRKVAAIF